MAYDSDSPRHSGDRDYLMRSEKRPNSAYKRARRRRRNSRILTVFAVFFGVLAWPVGMILLWLRQTRLYASTKVLLSMITLILCILLYGALLNFPFEDERIAAVQDKVNSALDVAYEASLVALDKCVDALSDAGDLAVEVGSSLSEVAAVEAARYIELGVDLGETAVAWVDGVIAEYFPDDDAPEADASPVPTVAAETASPTATPTVKPTVAPTGAPTDAPVESAATEATDAA